MKRKLALIAFVMLLTTACNSNTPSNNASPSDSAHSEQLQQMDALQKENEELKATISQLENIEKSPLETEQSDFRETLNLTFRILDAMDNKDFTYLKSISSSNVIFNEQKGSLTALKQESNLLSKVNFKNFEYRFFNQKDDKSMEIGFAIVGDSAIEVYFEYIKVDNEWLFNGVLTN